MHFKKLLNKPSILFIIGYSILIISIKTLIPYHNFISYDNFGYYMHLPAKYIYKDEALKTGWFEDVTAKYRNEGYFSQTAKTEKGTTIMRFYKGMSYIWTPPFALAHLIAKNSGYESDGFSLPYHKTLVYYGALFNILGLIFSRKILRHFFTEKTTTITLGVFYLGTSIFFFGTFGNGVPHIYLFTLFVSLIYWTIKWHENQKFIYILLLAISYGFIISIRPSDFLIIIIPFLWGVSGIVTLKKKLNLLFIKKYQLITSSVISILFLLPQFLYYYKYTGSFLVNIYDEPGNIIDFQHPRILEVLIGFRKGWFIYSPMITSAFIGLFLMFKKKRDYFLPVVIYLSIVIYIIASFHNLFSFGWRAFIQGSATLLLPMGFFIDEVRKLKTIWKFLIGIVIIFLILLNIHQAYQLKIEVLSGSRMTKEYYFKVLGKTKVSEDDKLLLFPDCSLMGPKKLPEKLHFKKTIISHFDFNDSKIKDGMLPDSILIKGVSLLNRFQQFSSSVNSEVKNLTIEPYFYIEISANIYSDRDISDSLFFVVNTKNTENESIKYDAFTLAQAAYIFKAGEWNRIVTYHISPEFLTGQEAIEAYLWYTGSSDVWIDDLTFSINEQVKD